MASTRRATFLLSIYPAAVRTARLLVLAVLAVCVCLALVVGLAIVAPDAIEPLWSVPGAPETAIDFILIAPMLAGIPVAWTLLALGRRTWQRQGGLAWLVGLLVFTAIMDVFLAGAWLSGFPLGDRVPDVPDPTLLERMGEFFPLALAGGFIAGTLWWLLLGSRLSRRPPA